MSVTSGDILRVVASFLWTDGNVAQNIFNAVVTGGGSPWLDDDIVEDAKTWLSAMYANMSAIVSDEFDGNEAIVYKYDTGDQDWDEVGSIAWTWNPSDVAQQLPRGVAGLVRMWTTDPDVQGKKYIAGLTEDNLDDGLWDIAALTGLLALGDDWATPFVGSDSAADWQPGIWSVKDSILVPAVLHWAAPTIPAYQRRRKRNVGV